VAWQTLVLAAVWYLCSGLSITGGYHRLFSHRAYRAAAPLKLFYLVFGAAAAQNSAINWASDHRRHHAHTDKDGDPYDARKGLWWSHMGWVFYRDPARDLDNVPDLMRDPLVVWQHRYYVPLVPAMLWVVPGAVAALWADAVGGALWAGCIRLVAQYHSTFSINSLAHRFGSQPYTTQHSARDNPIVALVTMGEGYHNFHHRFPGDYRNGIRLLDFDPTKWLVGLLSKMGVTWDLKRVSPESVDQARRDTQRTPPPPRARGGAQGTVEALLDRAGIAIDGSNPWDIRVHRDRFFRRVLADADLGFGESYMDGDWDSAALDECAARIFRAGLDRHVVRPRDVANTVVARLVTRQRRAQVRRHVAPHYDLGNDLFVRMLDTRYMAYTCAYWRGGAETLEDAQEAKLDLLCRKLDLQPGMRVLDIGCGWGGFAKHAAERYGVSVKGVTLSKEQAALGNARCKGLPVELLVQDYRDVPGTFDRVVSIGCLEHVGHRNHRRFFEVIRERLAPGGHAVTHFIGVAKTEYRSGRFLNKYVFPLVNLPSIAQVGDAIDGLFILDDVQNIGTDYDRTLMEWNTRFQQAWPELEGRYGHLLDGRFKRMFEFYLLVSAGFVRSRRAQLWHLVLTPVGQPQPRCRVS
jgi:cyclopropane-fatty-acyl-phospholipid synthase